MHIFSKEDYYILMSDTYLMFNGCWLVEKCIKIKMKEIIHWASMFLKDYKAKFVTNCEYKKDSLDIEVDEYIINAMEYMIKTGNYLGTGAREIYDFEKAQHMLDKRVFFF